MADNTFPFSERISCTVPVACEATGLGRSKLYQLIGAGRIEKKKIDGRTLITIASLRSLIHGRADPQTAHPKIGVGE
jgi:hypothetical protein